MNDTTTMSDTPIYDEIVAESNPVGHEHGKGEGHTPVTICHNGHTITIDDDALDHHLTNHGDTLGECVAEPVEEPVVPVEEPPVVVEEPVVLPPVEVPPVIDEDPYVEEPVDLPPVLPDPIVDEDPYVDTPVESNPVGPVAPWEMPRCEIEDGSLPGQEFPCLWDAANQGNGQGCSFVLDEAGGTPHYVTDILTDGTALTDDAACTVVPVGNDVTVPVPIIPTPAQAEVSIQVPTSNPVGLAETGMNAGQGAGIALTVVVLGVALVRLTARRR